MIDGLCGVVDQSTPLIDDIIKLIFNVHFCTIHYLNMVVI